MNLPRQPQPVKLTLKGQPEDVRRYMALIARRIEAIGFDHVTISGENELTIHPAAVND